eukprot:m.136213 g.136213  ORF g.136213 m.136213 type:complete len:63 (+) comp16022_c2_seq15:2117-2305(+)
MFQDDIFSFDFEGKLSEHDPDALKIAEQVRDPEILIFISSCKIHLKYNKTWHTFDSFVWSPS